jgi:hypothetical protein
MTLGYLFSFLRVVMDKIQAATTGDDEGNVVSSHPFISKDGYRSSTGDSSKRPPRAVNQKIRVTELFRNVEVNMRNCCSRPTTTRNALYQYLKPAGNSRRLSLIPTGLSVTSYLVKVIQC